GGAQLGAGLVERCPGSEAPKQLSHAMDAPGHHGCRKMMRTGDHVGEDFSLLRIGHAGFEDADDRRRYAAEANGLPEDLRILIETGRPEMICENCHAIGVRAVVFGPDETPEHRMKTHHIEI